MILLCPLIHPPNRCRSQWLYTNAFFPSILWISVRLVSSGNERCSKGETRVWAFLCLCLEEPCWYACICVCVHVRALCCCVTGWDGGSLEREFVCVCHLLQSAPFTLDGLFARHRHKIIRPVVVCLWSVLSCPSWFVNHGGSAQYGCCLRISHLSCFVRRAANLMGDPYAAHVWCYSITFSLFTLHALIIFIISLPLIFPHYFKKVSCL